jgi:F0F1-type ATP synthase beta subunit
VLSPSCCIINTTSLEATCPPPCVDQSTTAKVLETGLKVVSLLTPYACGGKVGLIKGCFVGGSESVVETWNIGIESKNHSESLTFLTLVYLQQLASSF